MHEIRLQNNNDERNLKLMKQTCDKMKDEIVMNFVKPKVISAYVHY